MLLRGLGLIIWGVVCGALFILLFVSKIRSGPLIAYLLMAACLSSTWMSVSAGWKLLGTSSPGELQSQEAP